MNMSLKNDILVLSLLSEIPERLKDYFAKKNIKFESVHESTSQNWTHILASEEQLDLIIQNYQPIENNLATILYGEVSDISHFIQANGKMIIDQTWLKTELSTLILDKLFNAQGGVNLEENYPIFKQNGQFAIVDPYFSNDSMDKLTLDVLENKFSGARVKSFMDHLVLYFAHLKGDFKEIFPFEVNYGVFGNIYGLQVSFSSREIYLHDLAFSLNEYVENSSLFYAFKATDFLDFSYLDDVKKCTITALWIPGNVKNPGLLLNEIQHSVDIVDISVDDQDVIVDIFKDVNVTEEEKTSILKKVEFESRNDVVKGERFVEADPTHVINAVVEEAAKTHIHATNVETDIIQIIKGRVEEEKKTIILKSEKFDVDDFSYKVSSGVDEKAKGNDVIKVKALKQELPNAIKDRFIVFAQKHNIELKDVTPIHIEAFKEKEVPELIRIKTKEIDDRFSELKVTSLGKDNTQANTALTKENSFLKKKIQDLTNEIKAVKEARAFEQKVAGSAKVEAASEVESLKPIASSQHANNLDEMIKKMTSQKYLDEKDTEKMAELLEKEAKHVREIKEAELLIRKQNIESQKKELFFSSELQKLSREIKAKELIVTKTKDSFTLLLSKRDSEINSLKERLSQATSGMLNKTDSDKGKISSLERQLQSALKQAELYKAKANQRPAVTAKTDDSKAELRKMTAQANQLKNQVAKTSKELLKAEQKTREQSDQMKLMQNEIEKLKAEVLEAKSAPAPVTQEVRVEIPQEILNQVNELSQQLKLSQDREKDLEAKLIEAQKAKKETVESDANKGKTAQLEANMKRLTAEIGESRNQMQKVKQEMQKLRAENTGLQNMLEKAKKEQERLKQLAEKKPNNVKIVA